MTIAFAEYCMYCDIGGKEDYEYFHGPTDDQLDNLAFHVAGRDEERFRLYRYFQYQENHQ